MECAERDLEEEMKGLDDIVCAQEWPEGAGVFAPSRACAWFCLPPLSQPRFISARHFLKWMLKWAWFRITLPCVVCSELLSEKAETRCGRITSRCHALQAQTRF